MNSPISHRCYKLLGQSAILLVTGIILVILILINTIKFQWGFFKLDRWNTEPATVGLVKKNQRLIATGSAAGHVSLRFRFPKQISIDLSKLDSFILGIRVTNPKIRNFNIKLLSGNSLENYAEWSMDGESERMGIDGTRITDWQNYKLPAIWSKNHNFDPSAITDLVIDYQINTNSADAHLEVSAPKLWGKIPLLWPAFYNDPKIKPINFSTIDKSSLPIFRLEIPPNSLKNLEKNFPESSRQEVPAQVTNPDGTIHKVTVRLRGDSPLHYEYLKKSWRIIYKDDDLYQGNIKRLNLIIPKNNIYGTVLPYNYASEMGLLAPKTFPARLEINNIDYGLYVSVEQIDDFFLTSRGYHRGSLYFGDTEFGKEYDDPSWLFESEQRWELTRDLDPDQKNSFDPLAKLLEIVNLPLGQFDSQVESIMDTESYIKWYVLYQLFNSAHNDDWHNVKMFYNSDKEKFEMIVWDVVPNLSIDPFPRRLVNNHLTLKLFQIPRYRVLRNSMYLKYATELVNSGKLAEDLKQIVDTTKKDFVEDKFVLPSVSNRYDSDVQSFHRKVDIHVNQILNSVNNPKIEICAGPDHRIEISLLSGVVLDVNGQIISSRLEETPIENELVDVGVMHRVQLAPKPTRYSFADDSNIINPATKQIIYQPSLAATLEKCGTY